ncbi:MAG: hypothetical protein CL878_03535 [Dehalococcoidia bacterium]|nr:hypothetical protein [Dehalococcoidia bacterium]
MVERSYLQTLDIEGIEGVKASLEPGAVSGSTGCIEVPGGDEVAHRAARLPATLGKAPRYFANAQGRCPRELLDQGIGAIRPERC